MEETATDRAALLQAPVGPRLPKEGEQLQSELQRQGRTDETSNLVEFHRWTKWQNKRGRYSPSVAKPAASPGIEDQEATFQPRVASIIISKPKNCSEITLIKYNFLLYARVIN
jgi:hypothetical protein